MGPECASCGAANAADARFCAQCGEALAATRCEACEEPLPEGVRFCPSCGAAVGTARPGPREARKVVTALFADVVGSTALAERLDPEDFTTVVGGAVRRMAVAVEAFGGEVSELAGDGLLALFGAPVAHEDDPERAVLAGLRVVEDIGGYAREVARDWDIEGFAVRVGIETGLAVLGPIGGGGKVEYSAMGDSLNTAARLQGAAETGSVLAGAQTQRLVAPLFAWGEARALELKGKAEPVLAYPVLAPHAQPAAPGEQAALVGRGAELAAAAEAVDGVLRGSGGMLILSGEAGIGKTRLAQEVRRHFEAGMPDTPAGLWLTGRCVSYGESLPYWPFRAILRDWLRRGATGAGDLAEELRAGLEALVPERALELEPLVGAVLGVVGGEEDSSELLQRRMHDGVAAVLAGLAADGPVVVCLDDAHWADASSLVLVDRLLEVCEAAPLLLVLTARPERESPWWRTRERALRELPHRIREVTLKALHAEADRALLEALVGAGTLPEALEQRLLARAEGNPFYLEELVRSMADAGALVREDGAWRFDRDVPVEVPETVEKVILARIDRLDAGAHDVLAAAAVLGRQFSLALLEAVAQGTPGPAEGLRELERAELVREGARWPEPVYRFRHSLIQEAAYGSLLRARRRELHRRAAHAIEGLPEERAGELTGVLALHWTAAGDDQRALAAHLRAADAARRLYASEEAIEYWTGAFAAAERLGLDEADPVLVRARRWRALFHYARGDLAAGVADLERALAAARKGGDRELEVEMLIELAGLMRSVDFARAMALLDEGMGVADALADSAARLPVLSRLCNLYTNELRLGRALEVGDRALALAGDGDGLAYALDAIKLVAQQLGDLRRLREVTDRLIALQSEAPDDLLVLQWTLLESAFAPLGEGRWEEAQQRLERAIELNRRRGQRMHHAPFGAALCWLHRSRGEYERAVRAGRDGAESARELGHAEWAAWADADLGWALLESGAAGEAVEVLERGAGTAETVGAPNPRARCTSLLAWGRCLLGDRARAAEALAAAEDALGVVEPPPGHAWLFGGHAYLAVGRAHVDLGDPEAAQAAAAQVAEPAERAGWREVIAGAALVRGRAHAAAGDAPRASEALTRALAVAETTGLPFIAAEARAAAANL